MSLVRYSQEKDLNNNNLNNINSMTSNTQAFHDNQFITKADLDKFHQENEISRRNLRTDIYNELADRLKKP